MRRKPAAAKLVTGFSFLAVSAIGSLALGQVSLTGSSYSQNFNSYAGSLATVPSGWTVAFSGTSTFAGTGTGTSNSGGAWAYGSSGDFSFGALRSGTPGNITLGASFTNNTGSTIDSVTLGWDYEQWRFANTSGLDLTAGGALAGNATIDAKDFVGSATGTNGTVATTNIPSFTISGLNIANGSGFSLGWVTTDAASSDNGVAIDNFSLSYTAEAVPEPLTAAGVMLLAGRVLGRRSRFAF